VHRASSSSSCRWRCVALAAWMCQTGESMCQTGELMCQTGAPCQQQQQLPVALRRLNYLDVSDG
jgi:hypothetical protein